MKKAIIIGCPGSGKTTFSKALAAQTGLPLVHLDRLQTRVNWQVCGDKEDFDRKLSLELEKPEWIMDGNYNRTIPQRIAHCDTVFYFDLPMYKCLFGAVKRTVKNYGKTRDDVAGENIEKFDRNTLEFYSFILTFNMKHRKKYLAMLRELEGVDVVIFRSHKQAEEYMERLGD